MNATIERLRDWGCDINGAMERLLDDEELYLELTRQVADGTECEQLGEAIATGNAGRAFELAHMLKGMLGNMGLTPLYQPACEVVELLRPGTMVDISAPYAQLCEGYQELKNRLGAA